MKVNSIGIIGLGSMGRMLVKALCEAGLGQDQFHLYSRTSSKVKEFQSSFPGVNHEENLGDLMEKSSLVFLCVPPAEIKNILLEIRGHLKDSHHLVSIAACVTLENINKIVSAQVSKVIPSFVTEVGEGVFLTCHQSTVQAQAKENLAQLLGRVGIVREIREELFEVYSDITSCGPGIFSAVFSQFLSSAEKHAAIDRQEAWEMFVQTLWGLAKLYKTQNLSFDQTIARVARKGGITETGVSVVNEKIPAVFDEVFEKTLAKHQRRRQELSEIF